MKKKRCYSSNPVLSALKLVPMFLVFSLISVPCVFASGSISGTVALKGRSDHSSPILFKLKKPGETTPIATYQVAIDNLGSYVITDIPAGTYNLSAKSPNCLSQNLVLIEVFDGQATSDINFSLLGGDADGNNAVTMADLSVWRATYGSTTDRRADFNGNGLVEMADMSILRSNLGKTGAQ